VYSAVALWRKAWYNGNMDNEILFVQSAFKHGISKADIYCAFDTFIFEDPVDDGTDNKFLLIGFDANGNPLEVMYNRIGSETVKVFHAMKCRRALIDQLGL
jgi:uncharacterized DUF497 family protein